MLPPVAGITSETIKSRLQKLRTKNSSNDSMELCYKEVQETILKEFLSEFEVNRYGNYSKCVIVLISLLCIF